MDTRNIRTNGVNLHVVDEGQGPAVLLLHGFPDSSKLWRHQIPALVQAGFRAVAPDLRGFGQSDMPPGVENYALPVILQDVLGILNELQIDRAHVVAHDWGAAAGKMAYRTYNYNLAESVVPFSMITKRARTNDPRVLRFRKLIESELPPRRRAG